jgi:hypothetical protein
MDLFVDFPETTVSDLPAILDGFPVPQQHGYVDGINEEESTVHVILLGSSSAVATDKESTALIKLDPTNHDAKQYLMEMKQRAPQCTAPTARFEQCKNRTLRALPDGTPRCYHHMSADIKDFAVTKKVS